MAKRLKKKKRAGIKKRVIDTESKQETPPIENGKKYFIAFAHKYDSWWHGGAGKKAAEFLSDTHKELFGKRPDCSRIIAVARVTYALQKKGYEEAGRPLTKAFAQNYKAALDNNINGFTYELKELLSLQVGNRGEGEGTMGDKKKVKKAVKKERGPSATSHLYDLLAVNNEKKLTDVRLQAIILKKFPDNNCYKKQSNISWARAQLNSGRKTGIKIIDAPIQKFGAKATKKVVKKVAKTPVKKTAKKKIVKKIKPTKTKKSVKSKRK